MSDYTIPEPEPKEIDERLSVELSHLVDNQVLRGHPSGDERCDNCRYYLEPYKDLSYCWHPKLRILVGGELVVPMVGGNSRRRSDRCLSNSPRRASPGPCILCEVTAQVAPISTIVVNKGCAHDRVADACSHPTR